MESSCSICLTGSHSWLGCGTFATFSLYHIQLPIFCSCCSVVGSCIPCPICLLCISVPMLLLLSVNREIPAVLVITWLRFSQHWWWRRRSLGICHHIDWHFLMGHFIVASCLHLKGGLSPGRETFVVSPWTIQCKNVNCVWYLVCDSPEASKAVLALN